MKITYYLEVLSSWCYWAEPTWAELKNRYAGQVEFDWKIALMKPEDFPSTRAQCDWFYRRSGTITRSPFMLNSGWLEPERKGNYPWPNLVAEAGKDFGIVDDRLRLALAGAGIREGRKIGDLAEAVAAGAGACGIDPAKLLAHAESADVAQRVKTSTAEFHALQITQRPAFVLTNAIVDKAVLSGLVAKEPLIAVIDDMLANEAAFAAYSAHHGSPPSP